MKQFGAALVFLLVVGQAVGQKSTAEPADHLAWIAQQLEQVETIKPGMTRADVKKLFVEAGGISSFKAERFNLKTCPYVRLEIEFRRTPDRNHLLEDVVIRVSRPLLERPLHF